MKLQELLDLFQAKTALNKERAVTLAKTLESVGIGMEPDVLGGARTPKGEDHVVLYSAAESNSAPVRTAAYQAATLTLQLASSVAGADGEFSEHEMTHLSQQVQSWLHLTAGESARLLAHLRLLAVDPVSLTSLKKKLDPLDAKSKETIAAFMATVAQADGTVTPAEVKMLEKVYKTLGLDTKRVFTDVHAVAAGTSPQPSIAAQPAAKGYEVGHALVTALQKDSEPVQKITIVPRTMGALGYVMQVPEEEKYLNTKSELEAMIVECLGGRAAEEIVFGNVTTGASNDIEKATKIVRAMITQYGMSEKFGLIGLATQQNQYLDGRMVLNCGDATATEIDHEVMKILKESYEQAKELLAANRDAMDEIAAYLIQKETITGKEFMEIFHQVIAKRNGNAEEAVENPENTETENTALPEADFTVNPEV